MSLDDDYQQQPKIVRQNDLHISRDTKSVISRKRNETKSPATRNGSVCSEKTENLDNPAPAGPKGKPMCFVGFIQPRMTSLSVGPNPDAKREETPPIITTISITPAPVRDGQETLLN